MFDIATAEAVSKTDLTDEDITCRLYETLCAHDLKDEAEHAVLSLAQARIAKRSKITKSVLLEVFGERSNPTTRLIVFSTDYDGCSSIMDIYESDNDFDILKEMLAERHPDVCHVYIEGKPVDCVGNVIDAALPFARYSFED
jgi:hypothetical protein